MEVEKKRSKGGFFNLFDWNGKSRKRLFANNSEPPKELRQGQAIGSSANLRPQKTEMDTYKADLRNRGSSNFESSSSVTSDEGNGRKAPGVVARLMGLDALPVFDVPDPCWEPYLGSHSLSASYIERNVPNMWNGSQPKDYSRILNKFDGVSSNSIQSSFHKVPKRPIERFQTEVLPPKSAKSMPITHHKLLSPIRSPGVITMKNADYIMEAAARIIEASPQTSRVASWSSSVPLRIRGLKEKMEAAHKASRSQRLEEPIADKFARGHSSNKLSSGGSHYTPAFSMSRESKRVGAHSVSDTKSVSLAMQAKVNLQRKGEMTSRSSSNWSSASPNENDDVKAKRSSNTQAYVKRTIDKGAAANRPNSVLKQNNQKQNSTSNKYSMASKSACFDQQIRNKSPNVTVGQNITVDKGSAKPENGSKKSGSVAAELKKKALPSRRNSLPGKKQSVNGGFKSKGSASDTSNSRVKQSNNRNVSANQCVNPVDEKMKEVTDVVSFTFTAPMFRPTPDPQSSGQSIEKSCTFVSDSSSNIDQSFMGSSALASSGLNFIGGDILSILLEQKLRELSFKVESSGYHVVKESGPSVESTSQASVPTPSTRLASGEHDTGFPLDLGMNKSSSPDDHHCSSVDNLELARNSENQQSEMEDHNTINSMSGVEFHCQHPTPILERSGESDSCSNSQNGSNAVMLMQLSRAHEQGSVSLSPKNTLLADGREKTAGPISFTNSSEWEFNYIQSMISNANLMFTEFAFGKTDNVISSTLFDEMENQEIAERNKEPSKSCKKLLFESLSECLDLRCQELFVGTMKGWAKFAMSFQHKERLVEELFKEIEGWKSMGEMIVDELVEKDMSKQPGRWLNFDVEAFEEGVDIENVVPFTKQGEGRQEVQNTSIK